MWMNDRSPASIGRASVARRTSREATRNELPRLPSGRATFFLPSATRRSASSVAQVVAGVSARMLLQIVLVVLLRRPELSRGNDLGDDRTLPLARGVDARFHLLGDAFLLVVQVEDGRAVLRPRVVPLPVHGGRVVHAEEPAEQLLVRQPGRVEYDAHRFGVAGPTGLHLLVGGVGGVAAGVADDGLDHAGDLPQDLLHPPEAAARQQGD